MDWDKENMNETQTIADMEEEARHKADEHDRALIAYQREKGLRGFFRVPDSPGLWSASVLVHDALRRGGHVEFGGLGYILGEAMYALGRGIYGEYYPYNVHGEHDHWHTFIDVLEEAIRADGELTPEKTEECYAPWMLAMLEKLRDAETLRRALEWEKDPLCLGERESDMWRALCQSCPTLMLPPIPYGPERGKKWYAFSIEDVYACAAEHPGTMWFDPAYFSAQQRDNIEAIRQYQKDALAGEAP